MRIPNTTQTYRGSLIDFLILSSNTRPSLFSPPLPTFHVVHVSKSGGQNTEWELRSTRRAPHTLNAKTPFWMNRFAPFCISSSTHSWRKCNEQKAHFLYLSVFCCHTKRLLLHRSGGDSLHNELRHSVFHFRSSFLLWSPIFSFSTK